MRARLLHPADYRRQRWKNGGGWTTELIAVPDGAGEPGAAFDWRVSIADIERDADFSAFPGCDRAIALLDGDGVELRFDAAAPALLREPLQFFHFAGEWKTHARLLGGPTRDFNVIVRRDAVRAEVLHRPIIGPMVFFDAATVAWFVYLVAGTAQLKDRSDLPALSAGESLLLLPDRTSGHIVLGGSGELVLVKLTHVR